MTKFDPDKQSDVVQPSASVSQVIPNMLSLIPGKHQDAMILSKFQRESLEIEHAIKAQYIQE